MALTQNMKTTVTLGANVDNSFKSMTHAVNSSLGKTTKEVKSLEREQSKLTKQIKQSKLAGADVSFLTRRYDELGKEISQARRQQESFGNFKKSLTGMKSATKTIIGYSAAVLASTAATTGALFGISQSQADAMDSNQKLADSLDLNIEKLQGYQYAAERSGLSSNELNAAIEKMTRRTANFANTGGGPAAKALDALGVSQKELLKLSTEEKMNLLADRLANVADESYRNQMAFEIFGLKGTKLTNMLKTGSQGLEQYRKEAKATGWVLDEASHRGAENFQDALLDLQLNLGGVTKELSAGLMPVFTTAMKSMTGWLGKNRKQVSMWTKDFAKWFEEALPKGITNTKLFFGALSDGVSVINSVAQAFGGWGTIAKIGASVIGAKAAIGVGKFIASGFRLIKMLGSVKLTMASLNVVMAANPIGLITAAVGGLIYAGIELYQNWDSVKSWFSQLWIDIGSAAVFAWDKFKQILSWTPVGLIAQNWGGTDDFFTNMWEGISGGFNQGMDKIKSLLGWSPVDLIAQNWDGVKDYFSDLWEGILAKFNHYISKIKGMWDGTKKLFGKLKFWGDDPQVEVKQFSEHETSPANNILPQYQDPTYLSSKAAQYNTQIDSSRSNQTKQTTVQQKVDINVIQQPGQSTTELSNQIQSDFEHKTNAAMYDAALSE